jgi:hypothetical protein
LQIHSSVMRVVGLFRIRWRACWPFVTTNRFDGNHLRQLPVLGRYAVQFAASLGVFHTSWGKAICFRNGDDYRLGPQRACHFPACTDDSGILFSYLLQWVSNSCSTGDPTRWLLSKAAT